ncbi:MAG TPA: hypothetical protein VIT88_05320 [Pyrinomonadaceae bacterium]
MNSQKLESELTDFHDPGMHVTWLVKDTDAFFLNPGPTSERDRALHFGLKYREWLALYFDVLGVGRKWNSPITESTPIPDDVIISEFDEDIPDYPLLSRINGKYHDAVFEANELEGLRQECLRVKSFAANPLAVRGLDKLIQICEWAQRLNLSIFLMCD